jgi:hypothetical protein
MSTYSGGLRVQSAEFVERGLEDKLQPMFVLFPPQACRDATIPPITESTADDGGTVIVGRLREDVPVTPTGVPIRRVSETSRNI